MSNKENGYDTLSYPNIQSHIKYTFHNTSVFIDF